MNYSKRNKYSLKDRKDFLKKAYSAYKQGNDTVRPLLISKIAYQYWKLNDTVNYKKYNSDARFLAREYKDTFALADTYWNDANIYKAKGVYDSAYYHYNKAYIYFESIKAINNSAKMLYGMAFIKGRYRDYTGSETLIFRAISRFKELKNYRSLYSCYNYLALLQRDIGNYHRSLIYHNKAREYIAKMDINDSDKLIQLTLNNIGLVYTDRGDYIIAMEYFNKVLNDNGLSYKNEGHYARVLDNKAYCKLLMGDTTEVLEDFNSSLKIRNKFGNKDGIVICKLHIAEYYKYIKDYSQALKYAEEAKYLSREIRNSRDYLASLIILSEIDTTYSQDYLRTYIRYNDSILKIERNAINKFTRISYETDQYIEANKRLNERNKRILAGGLGILTFLSLIYYIRIQRIRNKNLLLEAEQQKINEEYYLLTIRQQFKLEEEKQNERNRISAELHDGILSDLYGIRMQLGLMKLKEKGKINKHFESFLNELQRVEGEIREVSHKLNSERISNINNFYSLLKNLLDIKKVPGRFEYEFHTDNRLNWNIIDEEIKVNVYRILQEVIQNIVKHSNADGILLSFELKSNSLAEIKVKDNGIGFDVAKVKSGIGLKNIQSRTKKIHGSLKVKSELNKGTEIAILIPLKKV